MVVRWPYQFGPVGSESFHGPQGLPWDSNYSQFGILEHARHRFLSLAEAVVNADVDELVLTKDNSSVFELVRRSDTGYLEYPGYWIESATESTSKDRRHFDFAHRSVAPAELAAPKWTLMPSRCSLQSLWFVHEVSGMQSDALSNSVSYRHFRAISTGWKYPRGKTERPNARDHVRDDELMTWMQVLKLPEQEAWANDLAARLQARDQEVKVLANKLRAQEIKLQSVLS